MTNLFKRRLVYFLLGFIFSSQNAFCSYRDKSLINFDLEEQEYMDADLEKKRLQTVPQKTQDFVFDQLLNLCTFDPQIIPYFKKFGVSNFSSLSTDKREEFAKDLICDFEEPLFPSSKNKDVQESLIQREGILSLKSGKKNFLIHVIFPKLEEAQNKFFWEMSEKLTDTRMKASLRKNGKFARAIFLSVLNRKTELDNILSLPSLLSLNLELKFFPKNNGNDQRGGNDPSRYLYGLS